MNFALMFHDMCSPEKRRKLPMQQKISQGMKGRLKSWWYIVAVNASNEEARGMRMRCDDDMYFFYKKKGYRHCFHLSCVRCIVS